MPRIRLFATSTAFLAAIVLAASFAQACPFCSAPSLTMSEQLHQADAAVLVKWQGGKKDTDRTPGSTTYEISSVIKGSKSTLKSGKEITLARYRPGKEGDLFLLLGTKAVNVEWGSPLEVSEASYKYVAKSPAPGLPTPERLKYFLNYLEFPDTLIANDAYAEFANAPYKDITAISKSLPRERIRKWVASPETQQTRLGLYGLLLGLCGKKDDAKLMRDKILAKSEDFRLGIDGVMAGYLLLAGEDGLKLIEDSKLKDKKAPFSETYAAMQSLRFLWTYAPGKVSKERLRQSMRILLDRPALADLVIADLARWKDWSVQDKLMKLYGTKEYNIPSTKRAIVRYMLVSTQDVKENVSEDKLPAHVVKGKAYLAQIEKKDPKTVRDAKRFFFIK